MTIWIEAQVRPRDAFPVEPTLPGAIMRLLFASLPLLFFAASPTIAQTPAPSLPELGAMVKPLLVEAMPNVLYEHTRNWGHTTRVAHGVQWHGIRPEVTKTPRNDGHWQKIRLTPRDKDKLDFRLTPPVALDGDRQSFQAYADFTVGIDYEQQLWERGIRLYSGETRARVRVQALVDFESTFRVDTSKSFDLVFRVKATKATVQVRNLVVEHTAGIGGTGAKLIGEAIEGLVKEIEPNLQTRMQERMEAALVKAADTREIRVGFASLFSAKK